MKKKLKKLTSIFPKRRTSAKDLLNTPTDEGGLPRITNETIAANREEVLSSARKYIYPLQHSKHKIVTVSITLFAVAFIVFFSYCTLALYRFRSSSGFLYAVTQVIPFPVARAGSDFVSYENYLFELRHYVHYYEAKQQVNFKSAAGKQQLAAYRQQALDQIISDAYVKRLAKQYKVTVSDKELDAQIALVRDQNRLGASEKVFEDVLKENFGWTVNDFKRSLKQEMLAQKLVAVLDIETQARAKAALAQLQNGEDFAKVAAQYSDEASTKANGGNYGFLIDQTNRDIPPQVTAALFALKPGQTSAIINTGFSLEIVKSVNMQGTQVNAAHIVFKLKSVDTYVNEYKAKHKASTYIKP
ncbi:MAG TPA: SurA N-terminal domain-containing protein [Candidatus Saccharimonadales bacterium]|nr:SurA N-terminal domain-containing protein [Candidatus Saccharimonadales bacterium]